MRTHTQITDFLTFTVKINIMKEFCIWIYCIYTLRCASAIIRRLWVETYVLVRAAYSRTMVMFEIGHVSSHSAVVGGEIGFFWQSREHTLLNRKTYANRTFVIISNRKLYSQLVNVFLRILASKLDLKTESNYYNVNYVFLQYFVKNKLIGKWLN